MTDEFELQRTFRFEAAHYLPAVAEGHRCRRMHGHSYAVEVYVGGPLDETLGWFIDFAEIDAAWEPLRSALDHRLLNEIPGLENPTSEVLARWIWHRLERAVPGLLAVRIRETPRSACTYRGPRV